MQIDQHDIHRFPCASNRRPACPLHYRWVSDYIAILGGR